MTFPAKCDSVFGHRFVARFQIIPPNPSRLPAISNPFQLERIIRASTKRIPVHDVCVRCGAVAWPYRAKEANE